MPQKRIFYLLKLETAFSVSKIRKVLNKEAHILLTRIKKLDFGK